MNRKMIMALLSSAVCFGQVYASDIWRIGTDDGAAAEFTLAPLGYEDFLAKDFGYEDRYYLIGYSDLKSDFPYVLPGPDDTWGGTWGTAGWRTHDVNILFKPDEGYRSRIDKSTEETPLGYYKVYLTDTRIWAEVTATERAGFHRYTFPTDTDGRVMIDLHIPSEYDYQLKDVQIKKVGESRIEGYCHQLSPRPTVWSNDADQEYVVNFVIEFDAPIKKVGGWKNNQALDTEMIGGKDLTDTGLYVEFDTKKQSVV